MSLPTLESHSIRAADGTRLAAQSFCTGKLPVIIANGLGCTLVALTPLLRAFAD